MSMCMGVACTYMHMYMCTHNKTLVFWQHSVLHLHFQWLLQTAPFSHPRSPAWLCLTCSKTPASTRKLIFTGPLGGRLRHVSLSIFDPVPSNGSRRKTFQAAVGGPLKLHIQKSIYILTLGLSTSKVIAVENVTPVWNL